MVNVPTEEDFLILSAEVEALKVRLLEIEAIIENTKKFITGL